MIADLLIYFFISLFLLGWFYGCGWLALRVLKINIASAASATLLNLLLGMALHVIVFAIARTHFGTLNVILLGLLITIWLAYRRQNTAIAVPQRPFTFHVRELSELFIVALIFSLLRMANVLDADLAYPYYHAGRDDMFYSNVSYFISHYGVESFYLDWSSQTGRLGIIPYHYFELWLNALISEATGLLNLSVYYFITSLLITVVLYQCVLAIISTQLKQQLNIRHKALALALIFLGDLFFGLVSSDKVPSLTVGYSLYDNYKMLLVFILFALAWLAWKQERFYIAFIVLLIVPLVNYGLMPVILLTVPAFFIIHRWLLRSPEPLPYRNVLLSYVVYAVALTGIQKIFSNQFQGVTTLGAKELIAYYDEFAKVKTTLNYIFNYVVTFVAILLPYLFILWPLKKNGLLNARSGFYILLLMFLAAALVMSATLHFLIDTSQLFIITVNVVMHLFLFCTIPLLLFKVQNGKMFKAIVLVFLASGLYMFAQRIAHKGSRIERYSPGFLEKVKQTAGKIHGQGIRYLTPDYYYSIYNINPNCNYEGFYLDFFKNDVVIHTVTIDRIPDRNELHNFFNYNRDLILKSSFYLNSVAATGIDTTDKEALQLRFIKDNTIDFIVATQNAVIPEKVRALVTEEIVDPLSGEKLMLIDRKKLN